MTFDSQKQKDAILALIKDVHLRKQVEASKIVAPWKSESGK